MPFKLTIRTMRSYSDYDDDDDSSEDMSDRTPKEFAGTDDKYYDMSNNQWYMHCWNMDEKEFNTIHYSVL